MLDPQQVQDRGVQVVDMHRIADDVVTIFVGLTISGTRFDPGSREQHGVAAGVMVTAIIVYRHSPLRIDRTAKFPAPDNQRVLQQIALFEVFD